MSKLETKLINFKNALDRLREAVVEFKREDASDVVRDGLIQRFEFTYELSWKTTKEYLEDIGIVDKNSPKAVIKEAYVQKLIINGKNWLLNEQRCEQRCQALNLFSCTVIKGEEQGDRGFLLFKVAPVCYIKN